MAKKEDCSPEYSTMIECTALLVESIVSDVDDLGTELFSKNFLSASDRESLQITGPGSEPTKKANRIIDAVRNKIKVNPKLFAEFFKILESRGDFMTDCVQKVTQCYNQRKRLSSSCEPGFTCPCGCCTLKDFFTKGCPNATKKTSQVPQFPYLRTSKLSESDWELLERRLLSEFKKINESFSDFCLSISQSSFDYPIEDIKLYLLMMKTISPEEKAELKNAQTMRDILIALCNTISFFNYEIIEVIITKFAPSEAHLLNEYLTKFKLYCERNVFEVPPSVYHRGGNIVSEVYFSLKYSREGPISLNQVKCACLHVATILKIESCNLRLATIEEGCVLLKIYMPKEIAEEVLPFSSQQDVLLGAVGLRRVMDETQAMERYIG